MPTTVGPVLVTASGCTVLTLGHNVFAVGCAAQVANNTNQPVILTVQTAMPDGTPIPETPMNTQVLQARQAVNLPAPASGQACLVTAVSERRALQIVGEANIVGFVVLGLAAYGGYRLWQDHKHRFGRGY